MIKDKIEEICEQTEGIVSIANYNCPGQIVITGEEAAVEAAMEKLKEAGAKRCIPLKVSGPFHSQMLTGAGEKLGEFMQDIELQELQMPYVTNVTAECITDINMTKELLVRQVASSVRWIQSVEKMISEGVDTFIEIGPGKTLAGFIKKISRTKNFRTGCCGRGIRQPAAPPIRHCTKKNSAGRNNAGTFP